MVFLNLGCTIVLVATFFNLPCSHAAAAPGVKGFLGPQGSSEMASILKKWPKLKEFQKVMKSDEECAIIFDFDDTLWPTFWFYFGGGDDSVDRKPDDLQRITELRLEILNSLRKSKRCKTYIVSNSNLDMLDYAMSLWHGKIRTPEDIGTPEDDFIVLVSAQKLYKEKYKKKIDEDEHDLYKPYVYEKKIKPELEKEKTNLRHVIVVGDADNDMESGRGLVKLFASKPKLHEFKLKKQPTLEELREELENLKEYFVN